jgi:hypothetical protein
MGTENPELTDSPATWENVDVRDEVEEQDRRP